VVTAETKHPDDGALSTLEDDGLRHWLSPRLSKGRFLGRRRVAAWALISVFAIIPYVRVGGKPLVLLDIVHREFTILGYTFLPTDTFLLALFVLGALLSIFLITALVGRIWCGWACPQTVYLEFLYRPIERLFQGTVGRGGKPARPVTGLRRVGMYATYLVASMFLAHTFLAYFVGVENLAQWVRRSPLEHPVSFVVMAATTGLMMFDFAWFREQFCVILCPYGRLQSTLLDKHSLVIGYDATRGEPRGKLRRERAEGGATLLPVVAGQGDCVACNKCVTTCPTGIDIRDGLQLECIGCAQCIDACDDVMDRIGKPRGLIRYDTQARLEGGDARFLRPRVVIYPALLAIVAVAFLVVFGTKGTADVLLLRNFGSPFTVLPTGEVSNGIRVKVTNRSGQEAAYRIAVEAPVPVKLVASENPMRVAADASRILGVLVLVAPGAFRDGEVEIAVRVSDGEGFDRSMPYRLVGPSAEALEPSGDAASSPEATGGDAGGSDG
jgi:cytochrome c oxidase accessory protein FixG